MSKTEQLKEAVRHMMKGGQPPDHATLISPNFTSAISNGKLPGPEPEFTTGPVWPAIPRRSRKK